MLIHSVDLSTSTVNRTRCFYTAWDLRALSAVIYRNFTPVKAVTVYGAPRTRGITGLKHCHSRAKAETSKAAFVAGPLVIAG